MNGETYSTVGGVQLTVMNSPRQLRNGRIGFVGLWVSALILVVLALANVTIVVGSGRLEPVTLSVLVAVTSPCNGLQSRFNMDNIL